jgi:pentatricopeptide repeat protein
MRASQDCRPNEITRTILLSMCRTSDEIVDLVNESVEFGESDNHIGEPGLDASVLRAAVGAAGKLGDASLAGWLVLGLGALASVPDNDARMWNVLVGALAQADANHAGGNGGLDDSPVLDLASCAARHGDRLIATRDAGRAPQDPLRHLIDGKSVVQVFRSYLEQVNDPSYYGSGERRLSPPRPNSQTYCIIASVFQRRCPSGGLAAALFRNATLSGVPADGRFVNAAIRCFGPDLDGAIECWKREIRPAVVARRSGTARSYPGGADGPRGPSPPAGDKSLAAAYHGLLYVCGRAGSPQMALRVVYAMRRDGLEPDETALNCYRSGKHDRQQKQEQQREGGDDGAFSAGAQEGGGAGAARRALERLASTLLPPPKSGGGIGDRDAGGNGPYESLLYVECSQYHPNDRRRAGEQRVRIIV